MNLAIVLVIVALAIVVLLVLAISVLPKIFVPDLDGIGPAPKDSHIALKDQFLIRGDHEKRRNDLRIGFLQGIAGLAVIATLLITLLQLQSSQKEFADQQDLTRRGQLANRFATAIDELGKTDASGQPGGAIDVRLGGIYALESISRDAWESSPPDNRLRLATYEVLTAYIRRHAAWDPSQANAGKDTSADPFAQPANTLAARAPDVQAALTVLGRRNASPSDPALNLIAVDLRDARLSGGHFEGAVFNGAHLVGADFTRAHLNAAGFSDADVRWAFFYQANLKNASLGGTNLEGAHYLDSAKLTGALADRGTRWPQHFDPKAAGVQFAPAGP